MICKYCKLPIDQNEVSCGDLHYSCSEEELKVIFVSLLDDPNNGFYEIPRKLTWFPMDIEDGEKYILQSCKMKAGKFYNLPEFEGF